MPPTSGFVCGSILSSIESAGGRYNVEYKEASEDASSDLGWTSAKFAEEVSVLEGMSLVSFSRVHASCLDVCSLCLRSNTWSVVRCESTSIRWAGQRRVCFDDVQVCFQLN